MLYSAKITPLVVGQGAVQLQHRHLGVAVSLGFELAINGLHQVASQTEVALGFANLQHCARAQLLAGRDAGNALIGHNAAAVIDPGQGQEFRVLLHQRLGTRQKLVGSDFLVGHVSCQTHHLLLALQQAQSQTLLGVFHIPFDGFLLALHLFDPQIPKCTGDGC
jgi:hypothetical protein